MPDGSIGLPPYTPNRVARASWWNLRPIKSEKAKVGILTTAITGLKDQGLEGNDLMAAWVSRRIQPLKFRDRCMYTYEGINDSTRVSMQVFSQDQLEEKMKHLTMVRDNIRMQGRVPSCCGTLPD